MKLYNRVILDVLLKFFFLLLLLFLIDRILLEELLFIVGRKKVFGFERCLICRGLLGSCVIFMISLLVMF